MVFKYLCSAKTMYWSVITVSEKNWIRHADLYAIQLQTNIHGIDVTELLDGWVFVQELGGSSWYESGFSLGLWVTRILPSMFCPCLWLARHPSAHHAIPISPESQICHQWIFMGCPWTRFSCVPQSLCPYYKERHKSCVDDLEVKIGSDPAVVTQRATEWIRCCRSKWLKGPGTVQYGFCTWWRET